MKIKLNISLVKLQARCMIRKKNNETTAKINENNERQHRPLMIYKMYAFKKNPFFFRLPE